MSQRPTIEEDKAEAMRDSEFREEYKALNPLTGSTLESLLRKAEYLTKQEQDKGRSQ